MDSSLRSRVAAPTAKRLFVFGGVGLLVVAVVLWVFQRTAVGRQLRAVAADRETARLYGVRVNRVSMAAFGASAALAGLAGVLIGPLGSVAVQFV